MRQAFALIDQLIVEGVEHFCIAPGSRSAPLSIAAFSDPRVKAVVHFDERGVGFYAIGASMAKKKPAAIIVTSGTAAAHLFPSIIEAKYSEVPLLILSADRPSELRGSAANQTIDQVKIFGSMVKEFYDLAPDLSPSFCRSMGADAFLRAIEPPFGPVHLNCQFREPLYREEKEASGKKISFSIPKTSAPQIKKRAQRGAILIGKGIVHPQPILKLAKRLHWPVFADLLSNARAFGYEEEVRYFDLFLEEKDTPAPDLLLHFGGAVVSKTLTKWRQEVEKIHVSESLTLVDETRTASERIVCNIESFCKNFSANSDPDWLTFWKRREQEVAYALEEHIANTAFTEAKFFSCLSQRLPENASIFLGNSMPIREASLLLYPRRPKRFFANRGASGIDGNIATIAGLQAALQEPLFAVIGDLAALHDLNSLPLLRGKEVTLIISNNFGGGIFSHLPAKNLPCFEPLFATGHDWSFAMAAKLFDLPYRREEKEETLALEPGILEVCTDREKNFAFHESLCLKVTC